MIVFKKLTFKNFFSSGNQPVSFNLNSDKTTLIYGTNGSGKSTILDALCYALFGKPFRSINLPQLINSQNKRELLTEVEFTIGKTDFMVRRGMKPKVFEVYKDGELLDSKAADKDNQKFLEQNILKMNQRTFTQVVILGSSNFIPFMQLNNAGRRECIEDFLDIKVFSSMSILAKDRLRKIKEDLNGTKGDISNLEYKLDLQRDRIKELEDRSADDISNLEKDIIELKSLVKKEERYVKEYNDQDRSIMKKIEDLMGGSPKKMSKELSSIIAKFDGRIDRLTKDIDFYNTHDICPSCTQDITESTKEQMIGKSSQEVSKMKTAKLQAVDKLKEYEDTISKIQELEGEVFKIQQSVIRSQTNIEHYQSSITKKSELLVETKSDSLSVNYEKGKLQVLEEQLTQLNQTRDTLVTEQSEHEVVVNLLKESGVKTHIVKKYLPVMNKFIRKYLTDLDFPIFFTLDDQFNEEIQSPFHQNFSYASFSEGQKARIDLSLMLTWREIGKLKNSVSTNLLILDEVFSSSLDDTGKENLFALLKYKLDDRQKVIVVDHTLSQQFKDKFDSSVEVTMQKGFSNYAT